MSLALEIIVAILLACTISYAFVLNRRLTALRNDKARLEKLAAAFEQSTHRAETSVSQLKSVTDESVRTMQHCISEAQGLRDDLQYLVERGEAAADKLESSIRLARGESSKRRSESTDSDSGGDGEELDYEADAEQALMKALQSAR